MRGNGPTRTAGITLVVAAVILFTGATFLLAASDRPLAIVAVAAIAGVGVALILLSLPRSRGVASRSGQISDLLSVFFTFGALGPLIMMTLTSGTANFLIGLIGVAVSGGIATLWATAFIFRVYWLIPVAVIATAFGPPPVFEAAWHVGLAENFWGLSERLRIGILGLESVFSLVIGYALMVRFIVRVEREAARSQAELETASRIHAQLVPRIDQDPGPWRVRAISLPSSVMGGDLVDLIERADGGADLVLADVTGHGVRAGVVMALVKGVVAAELAHDAPLARAADRINRALTRLLDDGTFATAVVARLPADATDPIEILVAGHPPPVIKRAESAEIPDGRIAAHGLPWGVSAGETYATTSVTLAPGDALALYSDGLSEAAPPDGPMLGLAGVERAVAQAPDAPGLPETLLEAASTHASGTIADDRSVAVVFGRAHV
ncbi:MAG: PP2C family protein-serine/threonine phosphatase [Planctomycetota bacterium]